MTRIIRTCFTVALLLCFGSAVRADDNNLSKLAWLGGCWKSETAEAGSGEQWMPLAGGTLLGVSRTVRQGQTVEFEFMQIRTIEDGRMAFIAMPSGQSRTVFPLLRISDTEAVFEDLEHDFPQRVIYQLEAGTRLRARIEGVIEGTLQVIEFPMNRTSCDSQYTH